MSRRFFVLNQASLALVYLKKSQVFYVNALYFIMGKQTKKCPKKCEKHRFILKPVHYSAVFSRELEGSYCPASENHPSIMPKFNNDKKNYTVSFFLPADQQRLLANEKFYKHEHEKYKLENTNEKTQMLIPKPRAKYSHCSVCKKDYPDYLQHIQTEKHKETIQNNLFDGFINDMCEEFRQKNQPDLYKEEESEVQGIIQNKMFSSSQELTTFDLASSMKSTPSASTTTQFREVNGWLQTCKSFQLFPEPQDQNMLGLPEDPFAIPTHQPFSPIKKYSEATQGLRQVSNIKPIILCGGKSETNL